MKEMLNKTNPLSTKILFWFFFALIAGFSADAQIYLHDFGTTTINTHPYTVAPPTINQYLSNSSWTNSNGTWTSGAGATGQAIQFSTSAGTNTATLTFTVAPNYQLNVTSFNFWRQRSASGPQNWTMTINGITAGSGTTPTAGAAIGVTPVANPIAVTGTVNVVLTLTGATGGNFRLDDFRLNGTVINTCNAATISSFSPATGPEGTGITINGSGFSAATSVKIGGAAATFTVVSNTVIEAIVPAGATTGSIVVADASQCEGTSTLPFNRLESQCASPVPPSGVYEIFISEVYDQRPGSGGMIELYNPSPNPVNLTAGNYVLKRYQTINDTTPVSGYTISLQGSIAGYGTYLIGASPILQGCAVANGTSYPNGINENDKFILSKNNIDIDVAHVTLSAAGYTIKRKPEAVAPAVIFNANDWIIQQHNGDSVTADCANLGVHDVPTPPTVPNALSRTVCVNENTTFSSQVSGTGYTYQWKVLNNLGLWVNVVNNANYSGATTSTLSINQAPLSFDGNQYYCQITSANCNVYGNAARLSVTDVPDVPIASATAQPTCANSGEITISSPLGSEYTYSIGGAFQASPVFSNISQGSYTVIIRNSCGDTPAASAVTINPAPSAPPVPTASATGQPTCTTGGQITVTPPWGGPYTYSIDGTTFQASNVFNNVPQGSYTIIIRNTCGDTPAASAVTINAAPSAPPVPVASATAQHTCTTGGQITVTPPASGGPYTYSIDGTTFQASNIFNNVSQGSYTVTIRNSCGDTPASNPVTINAAPAAPPVPTASATAQPNCTTGGQITVTPPASGGPYTYSIDGTTFQASNVFNNVSQGSYTVIIRNACGDTPAASTVTINPAPSAPPVPVASATAQPTCTTGGQITVTPPPGGPYTYSIDGTTFQASNVFNNVSQGSYTVIIRNACGDTPAASPVTINAAPSAPPVPVASATAQPTCTNGGQIIVTPSSGGPYTYSIDGTTFQASNVFNNVPQGSYTVIIRNACGDTPAASAVTINPAPSAPPVPVASATAQPSCTTGGQITVTPPASGGPYTYSIDGTTFQAFNVFNNVSQGSYTVIIRNACGDTPAASAVTINPAPSTPPVPVASATAQPTCTTGGQITVTSPASGGPYTYSIDGTTFQASNIFNNVPQGSYTVTIRNSCGDTPAASAVTINAAPAAPPVPTASATAQPTCTNGGQITVIPPASGGPYTYSINGTTFQASNIFNNVSQGSYTVVIRNNCGDTPMASAITINAAPSAPPVPTASATAQPTCTTGGQITVTPPASGGPYTYSIDGTTFQASNIFNNVSQGSYTVIIRNTCGDTPAASALTINPAPSAPPVPVASATAQPTCTTGGQITVTPPSGGPYTYSIDGTTFQASNVFNNVSQGNYTVVIRNSCGDTPAASAVTINPAPSTPPVPVASATAQPTCTTGGQITVTSPASGGPYTYSIDGTTFQASNIFNNVPQGSYTVIIRNSCGDTPASNPVTINAAPASPPVPVASATAQPTCTTGGQITVTPPSSGGPYTYSINGTTFQASNVFNNVSQGSYTVIIRNACGDTPAASAVTINPAPSAPPVPNASATAQPTCNTGGQITVTPSSGGPHTYSINGTTFQASNIFNNVPQGSYTVIIRNACGDTPASNPVVINAAPASPPVPVASATAQPNCTTGGQITVTPPVSGGPYTYSIDGTTFQASNVFNNVSQGNYTVVIRNACGDTPANNPVIINPAPSAPPVPVASATAQPTCTTGGQINVTQPASGGPYTYSINGTTFQASNIFNNVSQGNYTVVIRNACGDTPASNPVVINPAPSAPPVPVASATAQPTCTTGGQITVTPPSGGPYTYSIDGTTFQASNVFNNVSQGNYTVVIRNSCGDTPASNPVVINAAPSAPPVPTASATAQPTCTTGGQITVTPPASGGPYTYSIDGTTFQASNVFNNVSQGNYTVVIRNSCGDTPASNPVVINAAPSAPPVPTASATAQPTCTTGGQITVTPPASGGPYTYSINNINFQASNVFNNVPQGNYTVVIRNSCGDTPAASAITINAAPVAQNPGAIAGNNEVCEEDTLQLSNAVTGGTWSSSNTAIATVDQNGLVTAIASGSVTITYTISTPCPASVSKTIRVNASPVPVLNDTYYLCVDSSTGATGSIYINTGLSSATHSFVWTKNNVALPVTTGFIAISEPGQYSVTATNLITGCSGSDTATVALSSVAEAYAVVGNDFDYNQTITVYVTGGTGNYEYSIDGENFQDEPYFTNIYQGEYTITVKDKNECGEITLTVFALNYPRFFSPNGDGYNETWNIEGLFSQKDAKIHIFDRFGKVVASIRPGANGWDGTFKGVVLPATDYWFTLEYRSQTGEMKEFKAHFSLIR